jgi:hypothetical protein
MDLEQLVRVQLFEFFARREYCKEPQSTITPKVFANSSRGFALKPREAVA